MKKIPLIFIIFFLSFFPVFAEKAELVIQSGNEPFAKIIAFSPDGKILAATGSYKKVVLWDIKTGKEIRELPELPEPVSNMVFSPDNNLIFLAFNQGNRIMLWSLKNNKKVFEINVLNNDSVIFSKDSQRLFFDDAGLIKEFDTNTGELIKELNKEISNYQGFQILNFCIKQDENILAIVTNFSQILFLDLNSGKVINKITNNYAAANSLIYFKKSSLLIINDKLAIEIDLLTGKALKTINLPNESMIYYKGQAVSSDLKLLAKVTEVNKKRNVKLYNLESGAEMNSYKLPEFIPIGAVVFSPDNNYLAVSEYNISIINLETGQKIKNILGNLIYPFTFFIDNKDEVLANVSFNNINFWNLKNGKEIKRIYEMDESSGIMPELASNISLSDDGKLVFLTPRNNLRILDFNKKAKIDFKRVIGIKSLDINKKGNLFAYSSLTGKTINKLIYMNNGKEIKEFSNYSNIVLNSEFTIYNKENYLEVLKNEKPYMKINAEKGYFSRLFLSKTENFLVCLNNNLIRIFNLTEAKEIKSLQISKNSNLSILNFSNNNKYILSIDSKFGNEDIVQIWNLENGKEILNFKGLKNTVIAEFSPDNNFINLGNAYERKLFRLFPDQKNLAPVIYNSPIAVISPDSKFIATSDFDNKIKLYDYSENLLLKVFDRHTENIYSIVFSQNSKILASAAYDGTIKIWDLESGKEINTLKNFFITNFIDFSNNNKILITRNHSFNNYLRLWDISTGKIIYETINQFSDYSSLSPDKKYLLLQEYSRSFDKTILFDLENKEEKGAIDNNLGVKALKFLNKKNILITAGANKLIKFTDLDTMRENNNINLNSSIYDYNTMAISPDEKYLSLSGNEKSYKVICTNTLTNEKKIIDIINPNSNDHTKFTEKKTISIDQKFLAIKFYSDNKIYLFSNEGKLINILNMEPYKIKNFVFNYNNYLAVTTDEEKIYLWDLKTAKIKNIFQGQSPVISYNKITNFSNSYTIGINEIYFDKTGKFLVSKGNKKTLKIFNIYSGKEIFGLKNLQKQEYNYKLEEKNLESLKIIEIFNLETYKLLKTFYPENSGVNLLTFSNDNRKLAAGSAGETNNPKIKIWEIESGKELYTFNGSGPVAFANNDNLLFYKGNDKSIKATDLTTKATLSFISVEPNGYIISSTDNYYMSSKDGLKGVAFRVGNQAYPYEQFDLKYNRPDIILSKLGTTSHELINAYHLAYQKRLKKLDFTEEMLNDDFHLPEIQLLTKNIPISTKHKVLKFKIKSFDTKYLIDRILVYVNDVPIYGANGISLRNKRLSSVEKEIELELSNGNNKIQFSAFNNKGVESIKETVEIIYEGKEVNPELYVIAIGVSDYKDHKFNLTYASKDANDLSDFFVNHNNKFSKIHIEKILDENATREKILNIKTFLKPAKVDDQVIVFLAGHGILDSKLDYYFGTTDIDFENPSVKGLAYDELESLLDGISARKKLLLIDSCNSGEIDKDEIASVIASNETNTSVKTRAIRGLKINSKLGLENLSDLLNETFIDLRRGSGANIISASGGMEFSYESDEWRNGVFTFSILDGLKSNKADRNTDGKITVSELREYVTEKVQTLTYGKQKPTSRREIFGSDFEL